MIESFREECPGQETLVSIGIPTFNRCAKVLGAIRSCLSQSWTNVEVIVSDNCSEDSTKEVVAAIQDLRLKFYSQSNNIGMIPNWNFCLSKATGQYFILLSDDDLLEPDAIQRMLEAVAWRRDIPLIVGLAAILDEKIGTLAAPRVSTKMSSGIVDGNDVYEAVVRREITTMFCSVAYSRKRLCEQGGFPLDFPFSADSAATIPLMIGCDVGFVNQTCATYVAHSANATGNINFDLFLKDQVKRKDLALKIISRTGNSSILKSLTEDNCYYEIHGMLVNYLILGMKKWNALSLVSKNLRIFIRKGRRASLLVAILFPDFVLRTIRLVVRMTKRGCTRQRAVKL